MNTNNNTWNWCLHYILCCKNKNVIQIYCKTCNKHARTKETEAVLEAAIGCLNQSFVYTTLTEIDSTDFFSNVLYRGKTLQCHWFYGSFLFWSITAKLYVRSQDGTIRYVSLPASCGHQLHHNLSNQGPHIIFQHLPGLQLSCVNNDILMPSYRTFFSCLAIFQRMCYQSFLSSLQCQLFYAQLQFHNWI